MANSKHNVSKLGSVGGKILIIFVMLTVVGIGTLTVVSTSRASAALMDRAIDQLASVTELKSKELDSFLLNSATIGKLLAVSSDVRLGIEGLVQYHVEMDIGDTEDFDTSGNDESLTLTYEELWAEADSFFSHYVEDAGFLDVMVVCQRHGHVMFSHARESDLGANLSYGVLKDTPAAQAWSIAREADEPVFVDTALYAPRNNKPTMFMAVPVRDRGGLRMGTVLLKMDEGQVNNILHARTGLGETAETFTVGEDLLMRTDSLLSPQTHSVQASFEGTVASNGMDTVAVREALAGTVGKRIIDGYLGKPVLSAWDTVDFGGFKWAILTEMDVAEVREPIKKLTVFIVYIGLAVVAAVIVVSIIFSRRITKPLGVVAEVSSQIAAGDLSVELAVTKSRDEVGLLNSSFREMIGSLNDVLGQVSDAVDQVNSGSEQVAQTSQSLSQGSTEQASSLEEVSASMNEINSQSNQNSETALEASAVAKSALDSASNGNEQMKSLVAAMGRINDSSDKITKVVKVIDDIAFQINLLALNANVEAARAGKYGKGFAVVAEEVRNLAVRSAEAAKETTAMVDETTRNIAEGNKSAEATSAQLEDIVTGSTKVADFLQEIALASKEQAQGVDQINQGLSQIDQVTQSNTANAEQSAAAAEQLSAQAQQLRALVSTYKLARSNDYKGPGQLKSEHHTIQNRPQADRPKTSTKSAQTPRPKDIIKLDDENFGSF